MGAIIIRLLIFAAVLWLIRRIIVSFGGGGKTQPKKAAPENSSVMVKDPVCGMYMDSRLTVSLEKRGEIVYFCSEECKKKYLASGEVGSV